MPDQVNQQLIYTENHDATENAQCEKYQNIIQSFNIVCQCLQRRRGHVGYEALVLVAR